MQHLKAFKNFYLFKVNNRLCSCVFIVNFEQISQINWSNVSIVDFEKVNFCWENLCVSEWFVVNTRFFYKQRFFSTQASCCLTFSWIELQMLLIHKSIIILRDFLYLVYLCLWLYLVLFLLYLCDLFFIFIFIFMTITRIISWIQTYMLFCLFLEHALLF